MWGRRLWGRLKGFEIGERTGVGREGRMGGRYRLTGRWDRGRGLSCLLDAVGERGGG